MAPRSTEQFEEMKRQKRRLILDTAMLLFAGEGFYKTSIDRIAREAGISKGLMYNYFRSKEDLIRAIVMEGAAEIMELFDRNKDGYLTRDEMIYFIEGAFESLKSKGIYWKLYLSIISQPQVMKLFGHELINLIYPTMQIMKEYFREQGREDPEAEALIFGSMIDGLALNYAADPDHFPIDRIKKIIIERF